MADQNLKPIHPPRHSVSAQFRADGESFDTATARALFIGSPDFTIISETVQPYAVTVEGEDQGPHVVYALTWTEE